MSSGDPTYPTVVAPGSAAPTFSPDFLTRYEFVRTLGEGGMGTVHLFRQIKLDRLVAVKVIKGDAIVPDQVRRLLKEARILAGLSHPNILAIHDVEGDGPDPYLVSEYVEGETLAARLKRTPPLGISELLSLVGAILEALAVAHDMGVIHRDLKPENIFLTRDGRPKIGDFGLAKARFLPSGTSVGQIAGTPAYMSPEQCCGQTTTPASDLYSVGIILFEMLAGQRPFKGEQVVDYLEQHLRKPPPALSTLRPGVSRTIETVVARALAKDPKARFASAAAFHQALRASALVPEPARKPARWTAVLAFAGLAAAGVALTPNDWRGSPETVQLAAVAALPSVQVPPSVARALPVKKVSKPRPAPIHRKVVPVEEDVEETEPETEPSPIVSTEISVDTEDRAPTPSVAVITPPQAQPSVAASVASKLAGRWKWDVRALLRFTCQATIRKNGTIHLTGGPGGMVSNSGTWTLAQEAERKFLIAWKNGTYDTVFLTAEGNRLNGRNSLGLKIAAARVE
jgi:serine/threonine protein kinase